MKKFIIFLMLIIPIVVIIFLNVSTEISSDFISIPVESVEINESTQFMGKGETYQLTATILPKTANNKKLVWESSDTSVAVVSETGLVTFKGYGSVYITANSVESNKKDSCYFYVTDTNVTQVILYTLDGTKEMKVGETLTLQSQVLPNEAVNKILSYSSSNEDVAVVDENGRVTALSKGRTTIIATSEDTGCYAEYELTITCPIQDIIIEKSYILCEQSYCKLPFTIVPQEASTEKLMFSSSDETVATVDESGLVVFEKRGEVCITIQNEEIIKKCTLEYTDGFAKSIEIKNNIVECDFNDQVIKLDYSVTPSILYNTYVWLESSNDKIASINEEGMIELVGGGSCEIKIKTYKSEKEIIEKSVTLIVNKDCQQILIDENIIIAQDTYQLDVQRLPSDYTNHSLFYHTNSSIASVNCDGLVKFTESGTAEFVIYANEDYSDVFAITNITYTAGYVIDFNCEDALDLNAGQTYVVKPEFIPQNAIYKDINLSIYEENCKDGKSNVLSIKNNIIFALKGGNAIVAVSLVCFNNQIKTKYINLTIHQQVGEIELLLDCDMLDGKYVTANPKLNIAYKLLPEDATDYNIVFSVNDKDACSLSNSILSFNYYSSVTLTAINEINGVKTSVEIAYTNEIYEIEFLDMPSIIDVGEEFVVQVKSIVPKGSSYDMSLQKKNEISLSNKSVVDISGNSILGKNGGNVDIQIYINGIYFKTHTLEVLRRAEGISVKPANAQVLKKTVALSVLLDPIDSFNNGIVWEVDNADLAYVQDNVLYFNDYGKVFITACLEEEEIEYAFWIEYIEQSMTQVDSIDQSLEMYVGDKLQIDLAKYDSFEVVLLNTGIVEVDNKGIIHALNTGDEVVKVICLDIEGIVLKTFNINIKVYDYIREINLSSPALDYYNGQYYTAVADNELMVEILPIENVNDEVIFELKQNTIAKINGNLLSFYGFGTVQLTAKTKHGFCTKVWNVTYTQGKAIYAEYNFQNKIELYVGQNKELSVNSWLPNNTINKDIVIDLLSQNNGIIKIENNVITALKAGQVNICVTFSSNLTKEVTISVFENIECIEFSQDSLVTASKNYKLKYNVLPETASIKDIEFESSNTEFAQVDNYGNVTFNKSGTVIITARSKQNSQVCDVCEIKYTAGYPEKFKLISDIEELFINDSIQLAVGWFSPSDATIFDFKYQIIEETTESEKQVITINSEGVVKALNVGSAQVLVYIEDINGNKITTTCTIVVSQKITDFNVIFENVSQTNSIYYTAVNEIKFDINYLPVSANKIDFNITASNDNVEIKENSLYFKQIGDVIISFEYKLDTSITKNYILNYTNNSAVNIDLDLSKWTKIKEKQYEINVKTDEIINFEIQSILPQNTNIINYNFDILSEQRNSSDLPVCEIKNDSILATNGGIITYKLTINNLYVGSFMVNVTRECESIQTESLELLVTKPSYQLKISILPKDTNNKEVSYKSLNSLTEVSSAGVVLFKNVGSSVIRVTHIATGKYIDIAITYSKVVESIYFEECTSTLSTGGTVLLKLKQIPEDVEMGEVEFTSSDEQIATVTQKGRVIAGNKRGSVTITARLKSNPNIFTTKTFEVIKYITNIALTLDKVNDDLGIKGERVFGTNFVKGDQFANTYQMEVLSVMPQDTGIGLLWSSSDETIATVDENGLVTFLTAGEVTIRVEAELQYNNAYPVYDEYTFKVKSGLNIYSFNDLVLAIKNNHEIILQSDVYIDQNDMDSLGWIWLNITTNIYGNGHMLCTNYMNAESEYDNKIIIGKNDIIVDNITIRGEVYTPSLSLSDLTDRKNMIIVSNHQNVVFKNCIFENAFSHVRVVDSIVYFQGCIFRDAGFSCLRVRHGNDTKVQPVATVDNCLFSQSLFGAILMEPDRSENIDKTYASKLIIKNNIYIYNFIKPEQLKCKMLEDLIPGISAHFSECIKKAESVKHVYNGETYFNLGVLAFEIDFYLGKFTSPYQQDCSQMNYPTPYSWINISGLIYGITFSVDVFTNPSTEKSITPATTYDASIYKIIRTN